MSSAFDVGNQIQKFECFIGTRPYFRVLCVLIKYGKYFFKKTQIYNFTTLVAGA